MGFLSCYNYTLQAAALLRSGVVNANDVSLIADHTFRDSKYNINWTVTKKTKTSPARIEIDILSGENLTVKQIDTDDIDLIINEAGIRCSEVQASNTDYLDAGDSYHVGFNSDYSSYPYYEISKTQASNEIYNNLNMRAGSNTVDNHQSRKYITGSTVYDGYVSPIFVSANLIDGNLGIYQTTIFKSEKRANMTIKIVAYTNISYNDIYDQDPGEEGFTPTGARTTTIRPGIGGRPTGQPTKKQPDYSSDTVSQPGAPDETHASAVGSGFIKAYQITKSNLSAVGECLWSSSLEGFLANLAINPLDYIVSLCVFPCNPSVGASENIALGRFRCAVAGGATTNLGVNAVGNPLTSQFKLIDCGSISIPENWGNFLDYSQTTIELYLPFIGAVNIDVSECMGGSINVQYTVDFFTGMCVANVLCERSFNLPSGKLIPNRAQHSYQGNCAIQIPLSRTDYGSMVGNLINACTQSITNPVQGFAGIFTDAIGGGFRPNVSSKGNIVANSGFCSVLYPYIRITRPITAEPESYQEVMGYPSYIDASLSTCSGLCICDDINLKGIANATESELAKIRQLCKDGIYV